MLAAQGLQGLQGFLAAHGLQGLHGLQALAAQGLHGLQAFLAAQGLHGLQAFFAAHGLHGLQAFLAAHGLHGLQAAAMTVVLVAATVVSVIAPATKPMTSGTAAVVDRSFFALIFIDLFLALFQKFYPPDLTGI